MCFYWDAMQQKTEQLSLENIDKISKGLPNLLQLSLTGGEPSLREDLPELATIFCRNSNVAKCSINTNGMLTERFVKQANKFVADNPETNFRISISIDGDEKLHDKIRGIRGSYGNAMATMSELKKLEYDNLQLDVTTTISAYNHATFFDYVNDIEQDFEPDIYVVNYTRGITKEEGAGDIPYEAYEKISKYVTNRKRKSHDLLQLAVKTMDRTMLNEIDRIVSEKKFKYFCMAGKKLITIYQDGRVAPCEILETKTQQNSGSAISSKLDDTLLGKLQDFDFDIQKLLETHHAKHVKTWIRDSKCFCTFECARANDVIFNPKYLGQNIKNFGKELFNV